ncbi:MAG: Na+/H+ antiporter NhaA [Nocardioidaceae bacterium]|nr:Na+/H+ antiporter NhaA [Nocardioidaceae bacterium]
MPGRAVRNAFHRLSLAESTTVADVLRRETSGGLLLLVATVVAMAWANSPVADSYDQLRTTVVAVPGLLGLDLEHWAGEGLLAVFFLVAGLELKREFVVGDLSDRREAVLPVVAAVCGMVVPAVVYIAVNVGDGGRPAGWAVPVATDIAFALAVLAIVGQRLPTALRAFLLSLAVVDDLLAIVVVAIFFTASINFPSLLIAIGLLAAFAGLQYLRVARWWLYVPLGLAVWFFVHDAGVHATVAGVAIGLVTRVRRDHDEHESPAERLEHRLRPLSASFCIPVFALLTAGVALSGESVTGMVTSPVALGVAAGLVVGKAVGITGGAWVAVRLTRAELSPQLAWSDVAGIGLLAGIGFTVSLLLAELSFADEPQLVETAKTAVLAASVLAALLATVVLRRRQAVHVALWEIEHADVDDDGVPDIHQAGPREVEQHGGGDDDASRPPSG